MQNNKSSSTHLMSRFDYSKLHIDFPQDFFFMGDKLFFCNLIWFPFHEITLFAIWRVINLYHSLYINLMCKITRKREDGRILSRIQLFLASLSSSTSYLTCFISGSDVKTFNAWKDVIWYIINLFLYLKFLHKLWLLYLLFWLIRCFARNVTFQKEIKCH